MSDASFKREVVIPFGQALVIGMFFGFTYGFILAGAGKEYFLTAFAVWLGISGVMFFLLAIKSPQSKPGKKKHTFDEEVRIRMIDEGSAPYTRGTYVKTMVCRNRLIQLALGLAVGKPFSHSSFAGSGKLFTRSEYEQIRDEFVARGLIEWRNPEAHAQGLRLRRGGWAFTKHFSELDPISPPAYRRFKSKIPGDL